MTRRRRARRLGIVFVVMMTAVIGGLPGTASVSAARPMPMDVRGPDGIPRGTALHIPLASQRRALAALERDIGAPAAIRYNGLTATPNHLFSYATYLTPPSAQSPEAVARAFLHRRREIFRFTGADLSRLRLRSRAFVPDIATTILLFEQRSDDLPVYQGEVAVNVNTDGRIISVGGNSFPDLRTSGAFDLAPPEAIRAVAASLGASDPRPRFVGHTPVLDTYGDLAPHYVPAPTYALDRAFVRDVTVLRTVFPLGEGGRRAYQLTLTHDDRTWRTIIDASSGRILRRVLLTFNLGPRGGGVGKGRRAAFRPDIQDSVERYNAAGSARGKVFDGMPTVLSGIHGVGRATRPGSSPQYASEYTTDSANGRGFRFSLVNARKASPLVYGPPYSQVLRGLPDATHPTNGSRFGWFYLPTSTGGKEIDAGHTAGDSRGYGYDMTPEAEARDTAPNSPRGDGLQPFAVTRTRLPRAVTTQDGRRLTAVLQSKYAEGNNVVVADDRNNDSEVTMGIRAYAADRKFTAKRFDFRNTYELGGVDAGGIEFFPRTADADLLPGAMALFYYANLVHDYLYDIGYTEALWNYQQDNFGRGGAGGDGLRVHFQSGGGTDNAFFSPTPEGENAHMYVYLNTDQATRRSDNAFEFDTIAHEFFHGVSTRSVGKGDVDCLGGLAGEGGGQGEGWSDYIPASMSDDDAMFEFSVGEFETSLRRLPLGNYRWSYGAVNGLAVTRRDGAAPELNTRVPTVPFEVHDIGELWAATLWDMRELVIVRRPGGTFFDGKRRLGTGRRVYIGDRAVRSIDAGHPIDYRESFNTADLWTIKGSKHIVRPGLLASEIAKRGNRKGPLAMALNTGARLADTLVMRGLQLTPCNPSFVQSRDSMLLADRELTGGENSALIWRAFASHGVGTGADSTSRLVSGADQVPVVVEDYAVPAAVAECERLGAPVTPGFSVRSERPGHARVTINAGKRVKGASRYVVSRATRAAGGYRAIATLDASRTTYVDPGVKPGQQYFYRVRALRNADCVSMSATRSVRA